jgi:hypothetical protein
MGKEGELVKLKIISYADAKQEDKPDGTFEAYYNPTSFTATYGLKYAEEEQKEPNILHQMRYSGYEQTTYAFELLLDGTGASLPVGVKEKINVEKKIEEFQTYVYGYDSSSHRGRYLKLSWGSSLTASVVLTSVTITRDLFNSNGETLRAKLNCQFKEFAYEEKIKAKKSPESPDMTHLRIVKQGDRLPQMCIGIYGDDRLYLEVARYNGIRNYRNLIPGQKIFFPPLVNKK